MLQHGAPHLPGPSRNPTDEDDILNGLGYGRPGYASTFPSRLPSRAGSEEDADWNPMSTPARPLAPLKVSRRRSVSNAGAFSPPATPQSGVECSINPTTPSRTAPSNTAMNAEVAAFSEPKKGVGIMSPTAPAPASPSSNSKHEGVQPTSASASSQGKPTTPGKFGSTAEQTSTPKTQYNHMWGFSRHPSTDIADGVPATKAPRRPLRRADRELAVVEHALALYQLTQYRILFEPTSDTKAIVAWNKKTIMISFRGTASLKAVRLDLEVGCMCPTGPGSPPPPPPPPGPPARLWYHAENLKAQLPCSTLQRQVVWSDRFDIASTRLERASEVDGLNGRSRLLSCSASPSPQADSCKCRPLPG